MTPNAKSRVCIIGLDGATFQVIDPLIRQNKLPYIAQLIAKGVRAPLQSTINPITPAAWTSFATGTNPGKHGVIDFVEREPESYQLVPVSARSVHQESLWSILSRYDKRVCVYNVPMTYPPSPVNGYLVSGIGTPSLQNHFTYPAALRDEILQEIQNYTIDVLIDPFVAARHRDASERQIALILENLQAELAATELLFRKEEWDLFIAVLIAPDRLQHLFWECFESEPQETRSDPKNPYAKAIVESYQEIDRVIGNMLAHESDAHIVLMSDHGFGSLHKYVRLNKYLEQVGLLRFQPLTWRANVTGRLRSWASRNLPLSLKSRAKALLSIEGAYVDALDRGIDWTATRVYSQGYFGNLFVNLIGREPNGVVHPGREYEQVIDATITALRALRDPQDGLPVVDNVYRREELYQGERIDSLPDLVVVMREYSYITRLGGELGGRSLFQDPVSVEGTLAHTGSHRLDGILIMQGPHVRSGDSLPSKANILDIAPTVLHLMGVPVADHMDGRVLAEALEASFLESCPVEIVQSDTGFSQALTEYDPDEKNMVIERLKGLGYL